MNCPNCRVGVLEPLGYVKYEWSDGKLEIDHSFTYSEGCQPMYICSLDPCSYVETKGAPGLLTSAKKIKKTVVLLHY